MAVSGSQLTRIGAAFSGVSKKLTIVAKAATEIAGAITIDVRAALLAYGDLAALVGNRIYRVRLPDNPTYPCILFRATEEPEVTLGGASAVQHFEYEFEIYADDFGQLESTALQLQNAMETGAFKAIMVDFNDDNFLDSSRVHGIFIDYSVWQ